jgi:glycosyltransferase involved in cell wall biosynthesis
MMRILIDGRPLQGPTRDRGVGHYVRDLILGLLDRKPAPEIRMLVERRAGAQVPAVPGASTHPVDAPPGPQLFWGGCLGPRWLRSAGADVWHATFLVPPRVPRRLSWVATIHDLIPLRHPHRYSRRTRFVYRRSLRLAARADRIIAVSRFTADRVRAELGVSARKIDVVPPPVDLSPFDGSGPRGIAGLDRPYLLHLGSFDPLKGVTDLLLPAFAGIARETSDPLLVMTGPGGPWRALAESTARGLGLEDRTVFAGRISEAERIAAIAGAAVVVVSSWEEGFGIPVIEAMAAGVPVAVGPAEATREAAGGLAALSDEASAEGLAGAIREALTSGGPETSEGAARRKHARQFERSHVAGRVLEVYRSAMEGK